MTKFFQNKHFLYRFSKSTILGLTLGIFLAAYAVFAFDPPASAPPGGNVSAPVTADTDQTITGLKTFNPAGLLPFLVDPSKTNVVDNLNSDQLDSLSAADLLAQAGGGGQLKVYKNNGTTLLGYYMGTVPGAASVGTCSNWYYAATGGGMNIISSGNCTAYSGVRLFFRNADCAGADYCPRIYDPSESDMCGWNGTRRNNNRLYTCGRTSSCLGGSSVNDIRSYRDSNGTCTNIPLWRVRTGSASDAGGIPLCGGTGPCKVKP